MKQKDITLIAVVVIVSGAIALIISNFLFTSPKNRQEKVEIAEPISADFNMPDQNYFNDRSIDPTQIIKIGESSNQQPFSR